MSVLCLALLALGSNASATRPWHSSTGASMAGASADVLDRAKPAEFTSMQVSQPVVVALPTAVLAPVPEPPPPTSEVSPPPTEPVAEEAPAPETAPASDQGGYIGPNDPDSNRALGEQMAADGYGWTGDQWGCLDTLWGDRESGWRVDAGNPSSAAYGIPQANPGSKMASAGPNWQTNPRTQIAWGLGYIAGTYETPCAALNHSYAHNNY